VQTLHLVDGTYELFRAHFSKRPSHTAPDGSDRKATVGVVQSLLALLQDPREAVTHLAVAFDNPIRSFRNDLYAGYKTDEGMPPELRAQFDPVEEAVAAIGVTVWSMRDHEADDALGAAAARFKGQVDQVRILSPDKDFGQCVEGRRVVLVDRMREKETDEDAYRAAKGIAPASVPDWLALVGDTADGYPGLDGFGEKGATALLAKFPKLEDIPRDARLWPKDVRGALKLAATLQEHMQEALLFRRLATLALDAPLPGTRSLEDLRWRGVPRARYEAWCDAIGAASMKTRTVRYDATHA
jgi:5'-3' exonuclease